MTDEQCVGLMATMISSTLVLADALTRKGLLQGPKVEILSNKEAVALACQLLKLAKADW